ncbi:rhamnose ABC transporter substrate-binding protein [Actinocrispum sp. NPDC049592]|uniref:rhamnose ABC transporter substrate-binding protein n=1 Tax=Actinocrispum sp. NPDC049592 TaxID=3154835 RepID=UPI00343BE985
MARPRLIRLLIATGLTVGLVASCGGTTKNAEQSSGGTASSKAADPNAAMKKGRKVGFLPKEIDNPYEKIIDDGGIGAIRELAGEGKEVGPSDASAASQVSYINTLIQQKQDAIVIAANDPNAVAPALKDAMSKGIAVVTFDSDAAPDARQVFVNQAESEEIGRSQVRLVAKQIGGKGKIAILSATPNATNQNTWIGFMKDELRKPEYKDIELAKVAYGDDDDQKSFQETQGLLQSIPDLKGIIAPTTVGISAAARYISSSPYKGKISLTGLGTPNQMRQFIKDGTVTEFALWDPNELGYLAGYAAAALASGQITGKQGETLKAGKLGDRKIGKNGEIILGPPTVFTSANIDQYNF